MVGSLDQISRFLASPINVGPVMLFQDVVIILLSFLLSRVLTVGSGTHAFLSRDMHGTY